MKTQYSARLCLALALIPTSSALASTEAHGGFAIGCFKNDGIVKDIRKRNGVATDQELKKLVSLETADLYEAEHGGWNDGEAFVLDAPAPDEAQTAWVQRMIAKLGVLFPGLGNQMRGSLTFLANDKVNPMAGIPSTDDFGDLSVPVGCVPLVVARRHDGTGIVDLDNRLYDHPLFSSESRYALRLHEAAYRTYASRVDYFDIPDEYGRRRGNHPLASDTTRRLIGRLMNRGSTGADVIGYVEWEWYKHDSYNDTEHWENFRGPRLSDALATLITESFAEVENLNTRIKPQLKYADEANRITRIGLAGNAYFRELIATKYELAIEIARGNARPTEYHFERLPCPYSDRRRCVDAMDFAIGCYVSPSPRCGNMPADVLDVIVPGSTKNDRIAWLQQQRNGLLAIDQSWKSQLANALAAADARFASELNARYRFLSAGDKASAEASYAQARAQVAALDAYPGLPRVPFTPIAPGVNADFLLTAIADPH